MSALRLIANDPAYEPATAGIDRLLLIELSALEAAQKEVARIEARIAPLARAWADARGEKLVPRIERLRREVMAR